MSAAVIDLRSEARRAMPLVDTDETLRDAAQKTWLGRMVNEYASSRVFEGLARHMEAGGFSPDTIDAVRGFALEERTHGVLCGAVVEALGGRAVAALPERDAYPAHARVPAREGVLRNLLSISCMSETVAVSLIGAERIEMPEGPLRELLTRIYSDEVGHARFGWRLVPALVSELDPGARARTEKYLRVAFGHLEQHELAHLPENVEWPEAGKAVGLCSGRGARDLFYETCTEVIVPGLERAGLAAEAAWQERIAA